MSAAAAALRELRASILTADITDAQSAKVVMLILAQRFDLSGDALDLWLKDASALPPVVNPDSDLVLNESSVLEGVQEVIENHREAGEDSVADVLTALQNQIVDAALTAPSVVEEDGKLFDTEHTRVVDAALGVINQLFDAQWHVGPSADPSEAWTAHVHGFGAWNWLQANQDKHSDVAVLHLFRFDPLRVDIPLVFTLDNPFASADA